MSLVEYHDPDGIFSLIAPLLSSRLPLRNLHWKSPIRQLRAIDFLHVDFVASDATNSSKNAASTKEADQNGTRNDTGTKRSSGARRHQIPGLRPTPFLKMYILRSDDKDVYKASKRKLLQDWVTSVSNDNGGSTSKQENHDACEWLILHVVLPGTVAASQPRFSKRTSTDSEQLKERSSSSKWPGRGSRPILEKLRADFNEAGKSATDRVAQIRLRKDELPSDFQVPAPATTLPPVADTVQEQESAWNDLITKLKSMILSSFDRRVTQYEEDVREKDAQRLMPGWNFCTFFVLKEGLTMAFESVGLLEDALAGYDELALGLENSIRNLNAADDNGEATTFLDFTDELQGYLLSSDVPSLATGRSTLLKPLTDSSQKYRELIAANQISVFNFQRYIFSRQMTLLIALAGIRHPPVENAISKTKSGGSTPRYADENPQYLAELGHRSIQFTTLAARVMKADIQSGPAISNDDSEALELATSVIVSSWIYAVAQEILDEAMGQSIPKLPTSPEPRRKKSLGRPEPSLKRRSSTQVPQQPAALSSIREMQGEEIQDTALSLDDVQAVENHSLANACAQRAELCLLQRRVLVRLAGTLSPEHEPSNNGQCAEEEEDEDSETFKQHLPNNLVLIVSRFSQRLSQALSNEEEYRRLYEVLSGTSAWYHLLAGRKKSAEKAILELATLKLQQRDFATAASHFSKVLTSLGETRWNATESTILHKYAQCLKALNRKDEYVRIVLALLGNMVDIKRAEERRPPDKALMNTERGRPDDLNAVPDVESLFSELVEYSTSLPYDISVALSKYFDNLDIDSCIHNFEDRDGFQIVVTVSTLLADVTKVDSVNARLISSANGQSAEIWLSNDGPVKIGPGISAIMLSTTVTTSGRYIVDRVVLHAGKLAFTHEPLAKLETTPTLNLPNPTLGALSQPSRAPLLLCYPRPNAFKIKVTPSPHTHLDARRSIVVELNTGANETDSADIILRPISSGLQLYTKEAEAIEGCTLSVDASNPSVIRVAHMAVRSLSKISLPYGIDNESPNVDLRVEAQYHVGNSDYTFLQTVSVPSSGNVDVSTQHISKKDHSILRVSPKWRSPIPVRLVGATLTTPAGLSASPGYSNLGSTIATHDEPVCLTFKVSRNKHTEAESDTGDAGKLQLTIEYRSLEDDVVLQVTSIFSHDLQTTSFAFLSELLLESLTTKLKACLGAAEYEAIALTSEVTLPPANAFGWEDILPHVPGDTTADLRAWLQTWHETHPRILLNLTTPPHHLTIPLAIPRPAHLFTTSLHAHPSTAIAIGTPLACEIAITSKPPPTPTQARFLYTLHADPSVWLICGPRRGPVPANGQPVPVCLVPLRAGFALLPPVDVELCADDGGEQQARVVTDCTSRARGVRVVEGVRSTTVGVRKGEAVLLEAGHA